MADTRKFGTTKPGQAGQPGQPGQPHRKTLTGEAQKVVEAKTMMDMPAVPAPVHDARQTMQMQAPAVAAALGLGKLGAAVQPPTSPVQPAVVIDPGIASGAVAGDGATARARAESQGVGAVAAGNSPSHAAAAAPKIELVKHQIPEDSPLDRRLVLLRDPDSTRAAAFRVLRHHLLERGRPRVIAVSSPSERDGKTTTAVNLALALAECGRARVLLIDANLRRPQLAGIFRFIPPWCFIEQLKTHRDQPLSPWGFVELTGQTLHIAAINPRNEQRPSLDGQAFVIAIERLRLAEYDHIVIDCPAVVGTADVNLVQDTADGVVLVNRVKKTTARDLRRAVEQLSPSKLTGIALLE